ncbi:hypothetical protein [Thermithiobacillus plumbiphilus]|uniref:Protein CopB n=1 Tax=Thermithiobacillus plumbiphilus TaxID=1729899 RepID=A0ABU9D5A7_9PROT
MEITEQRRAQLREAQRRRRAKLAQPGRRQINVFMTDQAINQLDALVQKLDSDRHLILESLIHQVTKSPEFLAYLRASLPTESDVDNHQETD